MPIGIGAAILGGSIISGLASDSAASKQAGAAGQSIDEQRRQYDLTRQDMAPWRQAGELSLSRLLTLMGLGGNGPMPTREQFTTTTPATRGTAYTPNGPGTSVKFTGGTPAQSTFDQAGYDKAMAAYQAPQGSDYGSLMRQFTGQDLQNDPGYQFGLSEGEKGINRAALARGGYDSGTTLKSLLKYNQDYAGTKFDQAFNRDQVYKNQQYNMLSGIAGLGQSSTSQLANLGAQTSANIGQSMQAAGDARAAGLIGVANAATGGLGTYLNYTNQRSLLDALQGGSNPSSINYRGRGV